MEIQTIINYIPKNEQEQKDKDAMILFANRNKDAFLRSNLIAHFTNSAIVINKEKTKVLFVNHLIYKSWGWVGGHNDGNTNFLEVVIREAIEETGVKNVYPLIEEPIALDNIYVPNHIKNGQYIGDHIHMNLTFVLVADEKDELTTKVDENSGVRWFLIDEVLNHVTESRMISIYNKVFKALKNL
ncbi:NUDIX hydrolase [Acholeplasma granularum]|uniref:NUDIX hydrolase n=1 Tax=Acholeplasma granularum TaxID=264635 RepID=UPI00046EE5EA|nr:NUDIX domain-containing protein [Acholeplasma granularum]